MGAVDIIDVHYGPESMNQAYDTLVADALHDRGHGGYSGTISETSGVFLAHGFRADQPIREDEASEIAYKRMLDNDEVTKWGPAGAIPVLKVERAQSVRLNEQVVTLTVASEKLKDQDYMKSEIAKALNKAVRENKTTLVAPAGVTVPKRLSAKHIESFYNYAHPEHTGKATTTRTEGKTVTRYFVIDTDTPRFPKWDEGYATQAEARKNLPTTVTGTGWTGAEPPKTKNYAIFPITAREDGTPVVEHVVVPEKTTLSVRVNVEVETVPEKVTTERGWLFFAIASC